MAISVGVARPGPISSVTNASPGRISGVNVANPGFISGVTNNYGIQGGAYSPTPIPLTMATAPAPTIQNPTLQSAEALLASIRASQPRQVYAPKLDLNAINSQARKQAEEAVNPLYTKRLNDLLARQALRKTRGQEDFTQSAQALEEALKLTEEQNLTKRARTSEDVATATGEINTVADRAQTAGGTAFEDQRLANARALAASGGAGAGAGQQVIQKAVENRNVTEQQQEEDFQGQRVAQAVMKARTFEDLAKSDIQAGKSTEKGKKQAQFTLDRLIQDIDYETEATRQDLESSRYRDVAQQSQGYGQQLVNAFIASIRDPAQRQAAAQTYGGVF